MDQSTVLFAAAFLLMAIRDRLLVAYAGLVALYFIFAIVWLAQHEWAFFTAGFLDVLTAWFFATIAGLVVGGIIFRLLGGKPPTST